MRILIVAATALEIAPLLSSLDMTAGKSTLRKERYRDHAVDVLTTGVGMVATASRVSQTLARSTYDIAVNIGVCGSFDTALPPGSVVHVVSDRLPELGAEDGDTFLSVQELQLLAPDEFPFSDGRLINHSPPINRVLDAMPRVDGITVNTVHGHEPSIERIVRRHAPQVETMEGAAFMYACLIAGVPFAQVRAVSNMVERRNRAAWKMADAIERLRHAGHQLLDSL